MEEEITDNTEMKERGEKEADVQEGEEDETSFTDNQRRDESILIIDGSNPIFTRVGDEVDIDLDMKSRLSKARKGDGVIRRSMIHDMTEFLKDGVGITVNKGAGPSSTLLYDNMKIDISRKTGNIGGARYKGKKILIVKGGKMEYSTSKLNEPYVNEFKELLRKADIEYQKTLVSSVDRHAGVDVTQNTVDSIVENVSDRIRSETENAVDDISTSIDITENELREIRGLLDPKGRTVADKLKALKIESRAWKDKANEEGNTRKGKLYESIAKVADLKVDELRLRLNQKPETEEVINMVEEETEINDMTRFEKFKKWSRENLVNLSALSISIAGIITTVVIAGRNVLNKGGDGLRRLGKAIKNMIKKVWPVLAPLGTLILKIFEFLGKGLGFLAENLWILALALTYFIYNEYNIRYRPGKQ